MPNGTAIREEGDGHGVAQHMGVDAFADSRPFRIATEAFPGPLGVQPYGIVPMGDKECRMVIVPDLQILELFRNKRQGKLSSKKAMEGANR